jgi:hypothetical protein
LEKTPSGRHADKSDLRLALNDPQIVGVDRNQDKEKHGAAFHRS